MSEHREQVVLFSWANLMGGQHPELDLLFAIPNGGHRVKAVAAKMSAEGVRSGVPDIFLPVARDGFHGLFIEMKWGRNKPTDNQQEWLDNLSEQGYLATVCWGMDEAKQVIQEYLGIGE